MIVLIKNFGAPSDPPGRRYPAHVTQVHSTEEVIDQMALGRPVVAGGIVRDSWLDPDVQGSGRIPPVGDRPAIGGKTMLLLSWDPNEDMFGILMPWPEWGDQGRGWLPGGPALVGDFLRDATAVDA